MGICSPYKEGRLSVLGAPKFCFSFVVAVLSLCTAQVAAQTRTLRIDPFRSYIDLSSISGAMDGYFVTLQPKTVNLTGSITVDTSNPRQFRMVSSDIATHQSTVNVTILVHGTQVGLVEVDGLHCDIFTTQPVQINPDNSFTLRPEVLRSVSSVDAVKVGVFSFSAEVTGVNVTADYRRTSGRVGSINVQLDNNRVRSENLEWDTEIPKVYADQAGDGFFGSYQSPNGPLLLKSATPSPNSGAEPSEPMVVIFAS